MEIKNNMETVEEIVQSINKSAESLRLSPVTESAGTMPVDSECNQTYAQGCTSIINYCMFIEQFSRNIEEIGQSLKDVDSGLIQ